MQDEYYSTNSMFTRILDFDCLIIIGSDLTNEVVGNLYQMAL